MHPYLRLFLVMQPLLFILPAAPAQNLVPNPGFEYYSSCPIFPSEIKKAVPWDTPFGGGGSPDYFNSCSIYPGYNVPNNDWGYQEAHSGGGYAGVGVFEEPYSNSREYLYAPLNAILTGGRRYCVTFYVNLANDAKYAVDAIGAFIGKDSLSSIGHQRLNVSPQVVNKKGNIITDTTNWTLISGEFTAAGGEKFIILGNFQDDEGTDKIIVNNTAFHIISYYYIDDVSVVLCDTLEEERELYVPTAFSPNGDGENELLFVRGGNIKSLRFTVYDRWGEQVFETREQSRGWNGMYGGRTLPGGVYGWLLEAELHTGERITRSGSVLLVR